MRRRQTRSGQAYCIDRRLVTQVEYAAFVATPGIVPGDESPACAGKTSYAIDTRQEPNDMWPCPPSHWTPTETPDEPVECVDWCDAKAYCRAHGKDLCGRADWREAADLSELQSADTGLWMDACSDGGRLAAAAPEFEDGTPNDMATGKHEWLEECADDREECALTIGNAGQCSEMGMTYRGAHEQGLAIRCCTPRPP